MARTHHPFPHGAHFCSKINGQRVKLCPITDGLPQALTILQDLLQTSSLPLRVRDLVTRLIEHTQLTRKPRTAEDYAFYGKWLVEFVGDQRPHELKKHQGSDFLKFLREKRCRQRGRNFGKPLSTTAINHAIRTAHRTFNLAVEQELLPTNPWKGLRLLHETGRARTMTDDELTKFIDVVNKARVLTRGSFKYLVLLTRECAFRPSEVRTLDWSWVSWDQHLVIIPPESHKTGTTARVSKPRLIPLTQKAQQILHEWFERKQRPVNGLVFTGPGGKVWEQRVISQKFRRLCDRAGIRTSTGEQLVMYSLRHTRLTEVGTSEGWDFSLVQAFAGHTNPQTTARYVHVQADLLVRAAREGEQQRNQSDG